MSYDYSSLQNAALSQITEYGSKCSVTSGDTQVNTFAYCNKITRAEAGSFGTDTRQYLIPGNIKVTPQVGDTLSIGEVDYYVHEVSEESPTGVCVYYMLTVIA